MENQKPNEVSSENSSLINSLANMNIPERHLLFTVVGLGSAGHSRLEAILSDEAEKLGFELAGVVSRRGHSDYESIDQFTLDEVEKGPSDVVVICTETSQHVVLAHRFLSAGKHVIVEYPLSLTVAEAEMLYGLAEEKGLCLYVSQIERLSTQFKRLKEEVAAMGPLQVGLLYMARSLGDPESMGFLSFQGISRLSWLLELFGDLRLQSAQVEYDTDDGSHMRLVVQFLTKENKELTWIEEQGDEITPRKQVVFKMAKGNIVKLPDWRYEDWWLQDLKLFLNQIDRLPSKTLSTRTTTDSCDVRRQKLHVLKTIKLAEEVELFCSAVDV